MSELQEIDVYILPNGDVRLEVRGAKGAHCLELTRQVEELLGGKVLERKLTDEYGQDQQSQSNEQQVRT